MIRPILVTKGLHGQAKVKYHAEAMKLKFDIHR